MLPQSSRELDQRPQVVGPFDCRVKPESFRRELGGCAAALHPPKEIVHWAVGDLAFDLLTPQCTRPRIGLFLSLTPPHAIRRPQDTSTDNRPRTDAPNGCHPP